MNYWRQNSVWRSTVVWLVCLQLVVSPVLVYAPAFADEVIDEANKGQDTALNLLLDYQVPALSNAPPGDPLGANELNLQELFPGYDPSDPSQITNLSDLANSPEDLSTQGVAQQFSLQGGTDETSEAYQTIGDGAINPHAASIDMRTDTFLDVSREIISGTHPMLDEILTACAEDVTAGDPGTDTVTRLEDIWTCSQAPATQSGQCTVTRDFVLVPVASQTVLTVVGSTCTPGTGSGLDLSDHSAGGWLAFTYTDPPACWRTEPGTAHQNWNGNPYPEAWIRLDNAALPGFPGYLTTNYCGEFDTDSPTTAECSDAGSVFEHICRNAPGNTGGPGHSGQLSSSFGATGSCTSYSFDPTGAIYTPGSPVDYTGCTPERQTYCQARRAEYEAECSGGAGSCGGGGAEHWDLFQAAPDPGQVGVCSDRRLEPFSFDWSDLPSFSGMTFNRAAEWQPGEPRDDDERFYIGYYCGTHSGRTQAEIEQACNASADYVEGLCRNAIATPGAPIGGIYAITGRGGGAQENCFPLTELGPPFTYVGCSAAREAACRGMRSTHYNACMGSSGSAPLLNGTETISSPALGPGFLEVLADQDVFGTTVDFEETGFNPSDYGLLAGQYIVSDHVVTGNGITANTIDDHGSYASNWDFTATITAVDSDGFTVDATLYEIVQNNFVYSGCTQQDVQNVTSGQCTGSVTCTDYTPPCRIVDGVTLCEAVDPTDGISEVLSPWSTFTNGIPEMCWEADVQILDCVVGAECINNPSCVADCAHLPPELQASCLAEPCWIDAQGNQVCLDSTAETWANNLGEPGWIDDCRDLIDDPACSLLPDIACIQGMESATDPTNVDLCELRQRFFDCGSDVTTPGVPGADDVDVTCGAEIRCFGDECANTEAESNPDFIKAAVAGTAITESTKDMTCDIEGDPMSCRLFDGTHEECKDPRGSYLGIIPDCCKESRQAGAQYGDFIQYMQLARYSFRLARDPIVASYLASRGIGLSSGVESVVNFPADVGRAAGLVVTNGFNSALKWAGFDGVKIATETVDEAGNVLSSATGFGPLQQFIATGVHNFMTSIGAETFADSLFEVNTDGTVTDWAADGLGEMVGNVIGVLMTIYTVYSILKILGNILFACEEEELAFGVQQVNRACHLVGTYCSKKVGIGPFKKCVIEKQSWCCFSSPFARIINEQLREQGIGPDWGEPTAPNCEGIAISELENVDWDLVDLSEWEAILFEAGLVPDPNNPPLNFIPTDRHPGDATGGSEGLSDTEINTQIIGLMIDTTDSGRFDLSTAPLYQPDPELMPWYDDGVP